MSPDSAADPGRRLIIALDYSHLEPALDIAQAVGARVGLLKVGLELFNSVGPRAIQELRAAGHEVFYDAKLYDIPNTTERAAAAAGRLGVSMLNVHCLGGLAVMRAAKEGAARGAAEAGMPPPIVIGVTIITSIGEAELAEQLGLRDGLSATVRRLALLAREAGLDGVVASVHEVRDIKQACGDGFLTVTPGVRPIWARAGDQARVATPRQALEVGADYLVIGRPITGAEDPRAALERIVAEMSA